ncbi:MAG TPA: NUDIX hydrolase [Burkholderiales bacterium]|nr:NUDIX hydrolase [Burkholderiales bacterium]
MKKTYPKQEPDFRETGLSSKMAHRGSFFELKEDRVRLPDGKEVVREYLIHPGAVVIIPVLDNGDLVMEWQYRYALRRHFYELPAGKLDPGEDPLQCAKRELLEETGYVAQRWQCLGVAYPCVGYSNEKQLFYLAQGLSQRERQLDDGEFLEVLTLDLATLLAWVKEGKITDGKTLNGLFWFDRLRRGAI